MEQPIYADILFFINFSMDFLSLYLTAKILHLPPKALRMTLASTIGGVYGVAALFFPLPTFWSLLAHFLLSALLCAVAFVIKTWAQMVKGILVFYAVGFLLGGSMTAIYHLFNHYLYEERIFYAGNYETLQKSVGARSVLLLAAVSAVLVFVIGRIFFQQSKKKTAQLSFGLSGREASTLALIDTGNLLCDSVTGTPVAFVSYSVAQSLFDGAWKRFFSAPTPVAFADLPLSMARRVRMLYAKGVNEGRRTLFCLRPDWVKVDGEEKTLLLAVVLPPADTFGDCLALLPGL